MTGRLWGNRTGLPSGRLEAGRGLEWQATGLALRLQDKAGCDCPLARHFSARWWFLRTFVNLAGEGF